MSRERILIVEDEPKLADDLARALDGAGFVTEHAGDGEDAWFLCETEEYAGVILDLGLPKLDGLTVLKRLRGAGIETPVLILTARDHTADHRIDAFNGYFSRRHRRTECDRRLLR